MKKLKGQKDYKEEYDLLHKYLELSESKLDLGKKIVVLEREL